MGFRNRKRKKRQNNSKCEVIIREGYDMVRFRAQDMNELMKIVDIKLRGQKRRKVRW